MTNKITERERNAIFEEMTKLLKKYDYEYTDSAVNAIINEWETQKAGLIQLFKKHPNYVAGKFMIAFDMDYEREIDEDALCNFKWWLSNNCINNPVYAITLPEEIKNMERSHTSLPDNLVFWFYDLYLLTSRTMSEEQVNRINNILPNMKIHNGAKTSRVVNKICKYLGYDKHPDYNREFAKYADALSPMTIKRHTILSINPLDYLTMSFGNSWASCHTIDKQNYRGMDNTYEGCYSSGTISYMLDDCSMVLYVVNADYNGTDYFTQDKINRQMYHYANDKLIQGRLYPQSCDGASDEYTNYRQIVQKIIADVVGVPNLWTIGHGTQKIAEYVSSHGTHYKDYFNFNSCTISRLQNSENINKVNIGVMPICVECGNRHKVESNINCCGAYDYTCIACGTRLYEDDVIWVDDEPYCRDCTNYCDRCGCDVREDLTYIESEDRYVCNWCLDNNYVRCDDCGEYFDTDDIHYIANEFNYVCDDCLSENFYVCDNCGEYIRQEDALIVIDKDNTHHYYCDECYSNYEENMESEEE